MSEQASKQNFAFRFYKSGEGIDQDQHNDRNFKDLEWFQHKKSMDLTNQAVVGGVQDPSTFFRGGNLTSQGERSRLASNVLQSDQIINTLEQGNVEQNHDLRLRSTKIICTLGRNTKNKEPIKKLISKGMDLARLNMNYFEVYEQTEIINNVRAAAKELGKTIGIMVDLKGPLIRTLEIKNQYSIQVQNGQEIRISSNSGIMGDQGMFVIDYDNIHEHLRVGDKILVDYGGVVLTVIGFESEEKYLKKRQKLEDKKQKVSPFKDDNKGSDEKDSQNKNRHRKRKNSLGDEEFFKKEIKEMINEESQDEEDFDLAHFHDKKDQVFPSLPKLDSSARLHIQAVEELKNDRAQFDEVVKKGAQGFGAYQFAKKADKARNQNIKGKTQQSQQKNHNTSDLNFSSNQSHEVPYSSPAINHHSSAMMNYQMKRMSTDDRDFNPHQHLTPSTFKHLGPSKEYLQKKRMSRDEFLRDKQKLFKRLKQGPRSRKSQSPQSRNVHSTQPDHNTSCSVSESDNLSLLAHPFTLEKNNSSHDIMDLNVPLYQKERMLVVCRVENDGFIKENKPLYIPKLDWQQDLKLSVLGPKDIKILQNAMQNSIQIIAVSFVESREDIVYVKKVLGPKGQHIKLLAKIQSQKALQNFEQILEVCDGIIIARGYLGLSLSLQDVVYVQKYIIKKCNLVGKPVILSTQIMESMVTRLIPSRSEVVDISNAVYDGIDSLILSPETAIGDFYEQSTEKMSDICFEAETHINYVKRYQDQDLLIKTEHTSHYQDIFKKPIINWSTEETISSCAVKASFDVRASLIIVFTHSGLTARKVAKHKPKCPILAVTPNEWAARGVLLHRGVYSLLVGSLVGSDTLINKVLEEALDRKFIYQGDFIIITSGLSGTVGSTNLLKIIKV